jgi:hypothetical protein
MEDLPVKFFKQMRRTGGRNIVHVVLSSDNAPHLDLDCWCEPEEDDLEGQADGLFIFHKKVTWQ